jgi:hypothetical protein
MGLFKPAWQSKDSAKSIAAVQNTMNQKTLTRIAQEAHDYYVRILAALKLTDKELAKNILTEIAEKDAGYHNRVFAADELRGLKLINKTRYNEITKKIKEEMTEEEKEGVAWSKKKNKEFMGNIIDGIK